MLAKIDRSQWPAPLNDFWDLAGAVSVRTKVLGIVLALVLLLGVSITLQVRATLHHTLAQYLQDQGVSIGRDVAARATDMILINDLFAIHRLLEDTVANNPDVRYVFVLDTERHVLAHTFNGGFPLDLLEANPVDPIERYHGVWLTTDEGRIWDVAVPIFDGRAGVARVGLSEAGMLRAVQAVTGQMLLTTVVVSAVGIAAATFLTWILTRPILGLVQAAKAVEQEDFSQRVTRWANDEIGDLAEAFNAMTEALARAAQERAERDRLRAEYVSAVIAAQEDERKRIARELHDGTSQTLTSLLVGLRALEASCDLPGVRRHTSELRKTVGQTLEEVHSLALQLRPSVLDDLGLPAAIERQVVDCRQRYHLEIDLAIHGLDNRRLPAEVETTLYRVVQEALTNVARHANASRVSVLLEGRSNAVRVIVEDDGSGFEPGAVSAERGHLGLYGMRERAELLGGTLEIESKPGKGTSIFVTIPLKPVPENRLPWLLEG